MPLMLWRAAIRSNSERMTRGDHLFNFSHIGFDLWGENAEDTLFGSFFGSEVFLLVLWKENKSNILTSQSCKTISIAKNVSHLRTAENLPPQSTPCQL